MAVNASNSSVGGLTEAVWTNPAIFGARRLFYVCSPSETSFNKIAEVPKYVDQAVPFFMVFIAFEYIINVLKKGPLPRTADAFSSLSAGILSVFPMLFVRNIEMSAFIWIHDHYQIYELPWDSAWTWWLCMLGVDLGYYWVHRCAHEINFMWAAHQVHHSSEDYNLTTALRQSVLQRYSSWVFYLPMALFMPPTVFMVHVQLNLIFQFWIHTECIKRLGPLEWFLNTPSHHRVHHGRNRYCIDKNYAGALIIWDRMFGTFEAERDDDQVVYGLVHPLSSWDPIYTQFFHWKYIVAKAWSTPGMSDKLSVFLKGPGWEPGKPRTGLIEDIPDIHAPQSKYNKRVSTWLTVYTWVHFLITLLGHLTLGMNKSEYQMFVVFFAMLFLLWTLTNIGYIHEHKWYAPYSELLRCGVYLIADSYVCGGATCPSLMYIPRVIYAASAIVNLSLLKSPFGTRKKVD